MEEKKEIYSLNVLKAVCCIIVVLFHCPFQGIAGSFVGYFLRFPVPIFFMISGYFIKNDLDYFKRRIKATFKYILLGESTYLLAIILIAIFHGEDPSDVIFLKMSWCEFAKKILFGPFFNGPLWFLYALFWTWILYYIINYISQKKSISVSFKAQYIVVTILIIILIVGYAIVRCFDNIVEWAWIFRSFLLFGLPFVWIGQNIKKNEKYLLAKYNLQKCLLYLAIGYVLALCEVMVAHHYQTSNEIYFSTVMISFFLFLTMLNIKGEKTILSEVGKRYSPFVYIFQGIAIRLTDCFDIAGNIRTIIVLIMSFIFACVYYFIRSNLITKLRRN